MSADTQMCFTISAGDCDPNTNQTNQSVHPVRAPAGPARFSLQSRLRRERVGRCIVIDHQNKGNHFQLEPNSSAR